MQVLNSLWRITKLGFFVACGTGLMVWSACSSNTVKSDSRVTDAGVQDQVLASDQAVTDGKPDQKAALDQRTWDIPLE